MPISIVKIKVVDTDSALRRYSQFEKDQHFDLIMEGRGKQFAHAYRDIVRDVLSRNPKHKFRQGYPVGASGKASENIDVEFSKQGAGTSQWAITEGGKTPANQLMRKGLPPGNAPSIQTLREWAKNKNITFSNQGKTKVRELIRQKSRSGKAYIRSSPGTKRAADSFLYGLRRLIEKYGSDRPEGMTSPKADGHNWWTRYPHGSPRYDYVRYVADRIQDPKKALANLGQDTLKAVIEYVTSGRKTQGGYTEYFGEATKL